MQKTPPPQRPLDVCLCVYHKTTEGPVWKKEGKVPTTEALDGKAWEHARQYVLRDPEWDPPETVWPSSVYHLPAQLIVDLPEAPLKPGDPPAQEINLEPFYVRRLPDNLPGPILSWVNAIAPPQTSHSIVAAVLKIAATGNEAHRMLWWPKENERNTILAEASRQGDMFSQSSRYVWFGIEWEKVMGAWTSRLAQAVQAAREERRPTIQRVDDGAIGFHVFHDESAR